MALKFNMKRETIKKPISIPPAVKKSTSLAAKKYKPIQTKLTKNNLNFLRSLQ
jgi:hypothetical protein